MQVAPTERPLGELFSELTRETGTLVRQEVQLATTEMSTKARAAGKEVALVAAGGALAHAGILVTLAGVVLALGTLFPIWIAALLVGVVTAIGGYAAARRGVTALKNIDPVPQSTAQTLKEDKLWAKEQLGR